MAVAALRTPPSTAGGRNSTPQMESKQSLMFNPAAFAFVMADLPAKLPGANSKRINDAEAKVSMRWVEQYQIGTDQNPSRLDILIGAATLQARLACRVWG
jgi:hypothetical protein